jgi:hypothetical protein
MTEATRKKLSEARILFYQRGGKHPRLGVHLSAETRLKISIARTGSRMSDEARRKIGLAQLGTKRSLETRRKHSEAAKRQVAAGRHPFWRGGVMAANLRDRNCVEYKIWRKAVYQRDGYACVKCGGGGGRLEADHIKPFARFPKLRFEVSNGRTLCQPCHIATPTYGRGSLS